MRQSDFHPTIAVSPYSRKQLPFTLLKKEEGEEWISQVPSVSLYTFHALGLRQSLQNLAYRSVNDFHLTSSNGFLVMASRYVKTVADCIYFTRTNEAELL